LTVVELWTTNDAAVSVPVGVVNVSTTLPPPRIVLVMVGRDGRILSWKVPLVPVASLLVIAVVESPGE